MYVYICIYLYMYICMYMLYMYQLKLFYMKMGAILRNLVPVENLIISLKRKYIQMSKKIKPAKGILTANKISNISLTQFIITLQKVYQLAKTDKFLIMKWWSLANKGFYFTKPRILPKVFKVEFIFSKGQSIIFIRNESLHESRKYGIKLSISSNWEKMWELSFT